MAKYYYLPTASAIAVASFTPIVKDCSTEPALAVEYINYGIIAGLQITSLSDASMMIERILINSEFLASLHAARKEGVGAYLSCGFPRRLSCFGDSFFVLTDAPAAPEEIRRLCYGKPIAETVISAGSDNLAFKIGDDLSDHWMMSHEKRA